MAKDKDKGKPGGKSKKDKRPKPSPVEAEPVLDATPVPVAAPVVALPPLPVQGGVGSGLGRLAGALGGATLCYGEPVQVGDRVVVPVARMRGAGGYGFGRGAAKAQEDDGEGGGGGGAVEATPAGFLDITADGVRYVPIRDPLTTARALAVAASGAAVLVTAAIGLQRSTRRGRLAGLLR